MRSDRDLVDGTDHSPEPQKAMPVAICSIRLPNPSTVPVSPVRVKKNIPTLYGRLEFVHSNQSDDVAFRNCLKPGPFCVECTLRMTSELQDSDLSN